MSMDRSHDADSDVPIGRSVVSVGEPTTGGQRGGGDGVRKRRCVGLGPSSSPTTGRHGPILLERPPM